MNKLFSTLLIMMFCNASLLKSESALQQLYDIAGPPKDVPMPAKPSGGYSNSVQQTQTIKKLPKKTYKAPSTSAVVGATIFGMLLQEVLFDSPSKKVDQQAIKKKIEQERKAQEEAAKKAKEEKKYHQKLMTSFKSIPSSTSTTEQTSGSSLAFKTAKILKTSNIDNSSDEALRESASKGFDGNIKTQNILVENSLTPLSLNSKIINVVKPIMLCQNGKCSWSNKAQKVSTSLPKAKTKVMTVDLDKLSSPKTPNPSQFIHHVVGNYKKDIDKHYLILHRLNYMRGTIGKELLTSIAMKIIELTPIGEKFSLMKDVHELAVDDMQNTIKVAKWLGSTQLDNPPEITSLEEAAKPFLFKALGASESFEDLANLISDVNEISGLSQKLSNIMKDIH